MRERRDANRSPQNLHIDLIKWVAVIIYENLIYVDPLASLEERERGRRLMNRASKRDVTEGV